MSQCAPCEGYIGTAAGDHRDTCINSLKYTPSLGKYNVHNRHVSLVNTRTEIDTSEDQLLDTSCSTTWHRPRHQLDNNIPQNRLISVHCVGEDENKHSSLRMLLFCELKGALYRIQILCRRILVLPRQVNNSWPAGITKAEVSPSLFTPLSHHYRWVY